MSLRFSKIRFAVFTLVLALIFGIIGFCRPIPVEKVERQVFDSKMSSLSELCPVSDIVIVAAGEKSLEELGRWPWNRGVHARLLGRLGDARVVMVDILFPEESDPAEDSVLAEVVRMVGNTVLAMHFVSDPSGKDIAVFPCATLLSASGNIGFTNVSPDIDGLFRYHTPFRKSGSSYVPSLAVAALPLVFGERPKLESSPGGNLILRSGSAAVPVDNSGRLWVRFRGEPFPEYEFIDVLEGRVPTGTFRDKIVFVGATAAGIEDFLMVPLPDGIESIPGVRFHAEALNTMLQGGIPARADPLLDGMTAFLLSLAGSMAAWFFRPRRGMLLAAGALLAMSVSAHLAFVYYGWWISSVNSVLSLVLSFSAVMYVRFRILHRDWEIKTLSIGSIYRLMVTGMDSGADFGNYLEKIWPSVERDLGMKLLAPAMTSAEAREAMGSERGCEMKPGEVLIARNEGQKPRNRMLVRTMRDSGTGDHYCTFVGWDSNIPEEQVKSVAVWLTSSSWFYSVLRESERNNQLLLETIRAMIAALDAKDPATAGHSERVAKLSSMVAEKLGLGRDMVDAVSLGSVIHDVGKIGIPDSILGKEGPLTEEEYSVVREHPVTGGRILDSVSLPEAALKAVKNHHERLDGSGYPQGLTGGEIDMASRIVAAADVFDALLSDRPYRKSWSVEEACTHMETLAGKEFDEKVVEILLEVVAEGVLEKTEE
ncbi:MAG TPA: CHASE2 domain-containing protein [Synergistetes bacterium]|nr:CHASE2 domain-containing protein [Synergistota bacterium]